MTSEMPVSVSVLMLGQYLVTQGYESGASITYTSSHTCTALECTYFECPIWYARKRNAAGQRILSFLL